MCALFLTLFLFLHLLRLLVLLVVARTLGLAIRGVTVVGLRA